MKRGDVYWAELNPRSGSEQSGRRPVLLLSHDLFNQSAWQTVIVVPLSTSRTQAKRGPTAASLPKGSGGLPRASVALGHQITTLDKSKLTERIGHLSAADLRRVEACVRLAIDLAD